MTFIDDKINALPLGKRKVFEEVLQAISEEDTWLAQRGFGDNYSLDMIKLTTYREMFERDFSRLTV